MNADSGAVWRSPSTPFTSSPKNQLPCCTEIFDMDKTLLNRRKMLLYLGLGVTGAGAATAFGLRSNKTISANHLSAPSALIDSALAASSQKKLPEFQGISEWLNASPLTIANLKGQVVLVQFWTFSCINCQRTLPYIVRWHREYAAKGLKVIGVHTPEFGFERDANNVKRALQKNQITYPVPLDNGFKTWNAYSNQYWPNLYLADRQGILRYSHSGEGAYDTTEQTIRQLLG
jgi:thiol-disulfide isomerase/thioredoxin